MVRTKPEDNPYKDNEGCDPKNFRKKHRDMINEEKQKKRAEKQEIVIILTSFFTSEIEAIIDYYGLFFVPLRSKKAGRYETSLVLLEVTSLLHVAQ